MTTTNTPIRINDAEVAKLIGTASMRRKFPFLASAHTRINAGRQKGCGGCAGKKKGNSAEYESVRKAIATMPIEKKAEMKEAMGGRQVVVKYRASAKKTVILKF